MNARRAFKRRSNIRESNNFDYFADPAENSRSTKRSWSENEEEGGEQKEEQSSFQSNTPTCRPQIEVKHPRLSVPAEMEAATSTTQSESPPKLPADPSDWSIDDVIQHIAFTDPALGSHADLFRKHVSGILRFRLFIVRYKNV